jgi:hypothetical protein
MVETDRTLVANDDVRVLLVVPSETEKVSISQETGRLLGSRVDVKHRIPFWYCYSTTLALVIDIWSHGGCLDRS